jgi:hypothetical protein
MLAPFPGGTPNATKGNATTDDGDFDVGVGVGSMGEYWSVDS